MKIDHPFINKQIIVDLELIINNLQVIQDKKNTAKIVTVTYGMTEAIEESETALVSAFIVDNAD